jgi:hypothetical protein
MSLEFQDAATNIKIKAVAFDEAIKVVDRVVVDKQYAISKALVKEAFSKSTGYHDCDLHFYAHTKVLFSLQVTYHEILAPNLHFFAVRIVERQRGLCEAEHNIAFSLK